jgi:hypothetical protein
MPRARLRPALTPPGDLALPSTGGDDILVVRRESEMVLDGFAGGDAQPTYRILLGLLAGVSFAGGDGNEALTLDFSAGVPFSGMSFSFSGGAGDDALTTSGRHGLGTKSTASARSALACAMGSKISDGCQSAQTGIHSLDSTAVGDRASASAE